MSVDISTLGWATVTARSGAVLSGAAFTIKNASLVTVASGVTDANGQITGSLNPGQYTVTVAGVTKTVDVVQGETGTVELGLTEISTIPTALAVTTTPQDMTMVGGWAVTVTVGDRPIRVEAHIPAVLSSGSVTFVWRLEEDTVLVNAATYTMSAANGYRPLRLCGRRNPAAGSHTYRVRLATLAGTANMSMLVDAQYPAQLQVFSV